MSESVSHRIRHAFDKAAPSYAAAAVLQREISERLLQRLDYIKVQPAHVLDLGAGVGIGSHALKKKYPQADVVAMDFAPQMLGQLRKSSKLWRKPHPVCGDAFAMPFADNCFDVVFSSLTLQWCDPLEVVFNECNRVLKPGGALIFASLGPDTLKELRASWQAVDSRPYVNSFTDMHDVGDALLGSGFDDPVMDVEYITMTYSTVIQLLKEIKQIGAGTVVQAAQRRFMRKRDFLGMQQAYKKFLTPESLFPATYEVVYGLGWAKEMGLSKLGFVPFEQLQS